MTAPPVDNFGSIGRPQVSSYYALIFAAGVHAFRFVELLRLCRMNLSAVGNL